MSRRLTPTLRARVAATVFIASLVLLAALGWLAVRVVEQRMYDSVRAEATRALDGASDDIGSGVSLELVAASRVGEPIIRILNGRSSSSESATGAEEYRPTASTPDVVGGAVDQSSPVIGPPSVDTDSIVVTRDVVDGNPVIVASTSLENAAGERVTLQALAPLAETERTLDALRLGLFAGVPTASIALGGVAAVVTTRALRPVAVMRREADRIGDATLHQRLSPSERSPELAEMATTINNMLDRLESAADRHRQFASDVSHEFRSPLATIRGTLELAATRPDEAARWTPLALGEVDRLDALVTDLLTLSRLDEHRVDRAEIDLDDIVTEQASAARSQLVAVTCRVEHVRLAGDRRALAGLARNLVDNAVRHACSQVVVSLSRREDEVLLVVDDDGDGIDDDDRERVFERFVRLDTARGRDTGGSGLGLAIVAATAHAHGGSISVGKAPIGGARFTVRLPST